MYSLYFSVLSTTGSFLKAVDLPVVSFSEIALEITTAFEAAGMLEMRGRSEERISNTPIEKKYLICMPHHIGGRLHVTHNTLIRMDHYQ